MGFDFRSLPRPGSGPGISNSTTARPKTTPPDERREPDSAASTAASDESRFSLAAALVTLTLGCVVLAIGRWLPPSLFAGITGFGLLAYGIILWLCGGRSAVWHLSWWVLLVIYLFATGRAISATLRR